MPADVEQILKIVTNTQNKEKNIISANNVKTFASVDDFCSYLSVLSF